MKNDGTLRTKLVQCVPAADHATAPTATEIDSRGFEYAVFIVNVGVVDSGETVDIQVQTSATSGSGMADVTGAAFAQIANASDNTVQLGIVRLDGAERYLDLDITQAGAASAAYSVSCYLTNGQYSEEDGTTAFAV